MTVIKHYDEPVPFHKAMPGAKSIVIWKRVDDSTPAVARTAEPKNPTKPTSAKGITMTDYDTSRGPWHAMLDRQALALQAQIGGSYEQAFTKVYTDPANASIRDGANYDHLARQQDQMHGSRLSLIPVAKAASYDPLSKAAEMAEHLGPAHARLHSMAVDHQRAHSGMSYQQAYSHLYGSHENAALRNAVKAEHMASTMAGVSKAAPADPKQDDVGPGSAHHELNSLVMTRMKREPRLSYERAFTREYLHEDNRNLKSRVDAESVLHAQRLAPAPPFPPYTAPGHRG
jgi:hypothetical protein